MPTDIVFPKNNESEFIKIAEILGYSKLCFVYSDPEIIKEKRKKYEKQKNPQIILGILTNFNKIRSSKDTADIVLVESSDKDRSIIENTDDIIIFNLEITKKKDFMHQRASGLNHIMCSLAKRNNISIAFPFINLLNYQKKQRAELMGRIMQNIKLCRKYKSKTIIASFAANPYEMRAPSDLISFFTNLGMHAKEAKDSLNCV